MPNNLKDLTIKLSNDLVSYFSQIDYERMFPAVMEDVTIQRLKAEWVPKIELMRQIAYSIESVESAHTDWHVYGSLLGEPLRNSSELLLNFQGFRLEDKAPNQMKFFQGSRNTTKQ